MTKVIHQLARLTVSGSWPPDLSVIPAKEKVEFLTGDFESRLQNDRLFATAPTLSLEAKHSMRELSRLRRDLQNFCANDLNPFPRFASVQRHIGDLGDHFHARHNFPENCVLAVEDGLRG
jgi:hypothetical protein